MYYLNPDIFHPIAIRKMYEFPEYAPAHNYDHVCRYSKTRCIIDPDTRTQYHETVSRYKVGSSELDTYIKVERTEENRLDVIAYNEYGNSSYWWIIAMANNIIDAFNVPIGTVLRIPHIGNLYTRGNILGPGGVGV